MVTISDIKDPVSRFLAFVREREAVRVRREGGQAPPFTSDEILANYRFCNIRREDDAVTKWMAANWRTPNVGDPDLWFAMCMARFLNLPDSLGEIGYPVPWNRTRFLQVLKSRKTKGLRNFNAAYIVSTSGMVIAKELYIADYLLTPLWRDRKNLRPKVGDTLNAYHMLLGQWRGLGSFMAAQVVADMKYVDPLKTASDWWSFAASGPGSRRGLNRVLGRSKDSPWKEDDWRLELARLQKHIDLDVPDLHAQDIQNCLCEFDKYERTRLGEGRPKRKFP